MERNCYNCVHGTADGGCSYDGTCLFGSEWIYKEKKLLDSETVLEEIKNSTEISEKERIRAAILKNIDDSNSAISMDRNPEYNEQASYVIANLASAYKDLDLS